MRSYATFNAKKCKSPTSQKAQGKHWNTHTRGKTTVWQRQREKHWLKYRERTDRAQVRTNEGQVIQIKLPQRRER